ncbi:hypothetical protein D4764_19G0005300, partial [Takifugu flavidus]
MKEYASEKKTFQAQTQPAVSPLTHAQLLHCRTAPKPEVESAAHLVVVRIYICPDSGGCRFQSRQTGRLAEETTTAGHLTQP